MIGGNFKFSNRLSIIILIQVKINVTSFENHIIITNLYTAKNRLVLIL